MKYLIIFLVSIVAVGCMEINALELQQENEALKNTITEMERSFKTIDSLSTMNHILAINKIDSLNNIISSDVHYLLKYIDSTFIANSDTICARLNNNYEILNTY